MRLASGEAVNKPGMVATDNAEQMLGLYAPAGQVLSDGRWFKNEPQNAQSNALRVASTAVFRTGAGFAHNCEL